MPARVPTWEEHEALQQALQDHIDTTPPPGPEHAVASDAMRDLGFHYPVGTPWFDLAPLVGVQEGLRPVAPTGMAGAPGIAVPPDTASIVDFINAHSDTGVFHLEPDTTYRVQTGQRKPDREFWIIGDGSPVIVPRDDDLGSFLKNFSTAPFHIEGVGFDRWATPKAQNAIIDRHGSEPTGPSFYTNVEFNALNHHAIEMGDEGIWRGGSASSPGSPLGASGDAVLVEDVELFDLTPDHDGGHGGVKLSWSVGTLRRAILHDAQFWTDVIFGQNGAVVADNVALLDSAGPGHHAEWQRTGTHPQVVTNGFVRHPGRGRSNSWPGASGDQRNQRAALLAHQGRLHSERVLVEIIEGQGSSISLWEAPGSRRYIPGVTTGAGSKWIETVTVVRPTGNIPRLATLPDPTSDLGRTLELRGLIWIVPEALAAARMFRIGGEGLTHAEFAQFFDSTLLVYPDPS